VRLQMPRWLIGDQPPGPALGDSLEFRRDDVMTSARCEEGARVELGEIQAPYRERLDMAWRHAVAAVDAYLARNAIRWIQVRNQPSRGNPPPNMRNPKLTPKKSRLSDGARTTI